MTRPEFIAEVQRRLRISEGCEPRRYLDSLGIPTIGIGWNLQRPDTKWALERCNVADVAGVINGTASLTDDQITGLFKIAFGPIEDEARDSLAPNVYDALNDARRFVICDLVYNMGAGDEGWGGFHGTRSLISNGQQLKNQGQLVQAHSAFIAAGQHLATSDWYKQVGIRARRDVAMLVAGVWARADGDGADIA